jgi:short-subunit dehydrogenase
MNLEAQTVVVVTGASGGLGRATALEFASKGCRVVLAARRLESLEETATMCRNAGGEALVQVTDVTVAGDVEKLMHAALAQWGRIDVWVNNAGVTLFALLEERSFDEHRRVIETNLFGPIHAARAVLPLFRRQGRGVLVNVGSILSKVGQPAVPSYVISKFGLRGMSEALRMELVDEPDIHVCTILPYAIDTPHFQTAANQLGVKTFAMPPVQSPEKVAKRIVELAENPRRETHVPDIAVLGLALRWLLPETCETLIAHAVWRWHLSPLPEEKSHGNLFRESREQGSIHGDRPPRVSTTAFAVWAAGELVRMQAKSAFDWAGQVWTRAQSLR